MSESASFSHQSPISIAIEVNECHKKGRQYVPGECSGKWSDQQHIKYVAFIDFHKETMKSKEKRRSNKFYQEMASFIETRNALQCRSHHQKLEEKYLHHLKIIAIYKAVFDTTIYQEVLDSITHLKKDDKQTKLIYHKKVNKNTETQEEISQTTNNCRSEPSPVPYSHFPFYGTTYYPAFSNQTFSPNFPINYFFNRPCYWNPPVFTYGFESN